MKLQVEKKQDTQHKKSVSDVSHRSLLSRFPFNFMRDPFTSFDTLWPQFGVNTSDWLPKMDLSETKDKIKIKMNVPDVDPQNISIEVDADNCLTVSGSTSRQTEEEGETSYHVEREEGSFSRTITLPHTADVDKIAAFDKNGTMTIIIPKKGEEPKKKIPVNT